MYRIDFMGLCWILACIAFAIAGYLTGELRLDLKQQCAKQHNVYECVIVAVPKEGE